MQLDKYGTPVDVRDSVNRTRKTEIVKPEQVNRKVVAVEESKNLQHICNYRSRRNENSKYEGKELQQENHEGKCTNATP